MPADADIHVWLDMEANAGKATVIPYVKSVVDRQINYKMDVIKTGASGSSRISQGGTVNVGAAKPTALSRLTIDAQKSDECRIELVLSEHNMPVGKYRFDCPH